MLLANGVVWQVGERGSIYTSSDLDTWIPHESGTRNSLRSIALFRTNYFISGEAGLVLAGPSASELVTRRLTTTNWLEGIAASEDVVVVVGDNGAIYSSRDGTAWDRRGGFEDWLRSVAYGGNGFIAVGENGFIATSPDGENWEKRASGTTAHLNKAAWLNDRFWIVGDAGVILTNYSATSFVILDSGVTNTLFTVATSTNEVVIAGDGIVLRGSIDGSDWDRESDPGSPLLAPEWPYYASLWDGRLFLLGGQTGMLVEGFRTNETAPLHWYGTIQPTRSWLWSVARTADFYTAVGVNGTIVTSEDGIEWALESLPGGSRNSLLLGVGANTNLMVAVGAGGAVLRSVNLLSNVVSTNILGELLTNLVNLLGINWEEITGEVTNDLQGIVVTEDLIVVTGGNGTIMTSGGAAMGRNWTRRDSGVNTFLSGVTAWPEGFVAVGAAGVILTSSDGIEWTRQDSGVTSWIYTVKHAGGRLIATGESGVILSSSDGRNWTQQNSGTTEWLNDVTFAQGTWYIAGGNGILVTSADGAEWQAERSLTAKSLYGITTDGEQVIAVGLQGVILRKNLRTVTTPVEIVSYAQAGLSSLFLFAGQVDQRFSLEESDSILGPWRTAEILEITESSGTVLFELPNDRAPKRFFKTRVSQDDLN